MIELFLFLVIVVLGALIALLLVIVSKLRDEIKTMRPRMLAEAAEVLKKGEKAMRADAIKRSTYVVKGKVAEQLVPFGSDFGYNPRDCRFLGSPVDFIVFDGLTEGALGEIVIVEIKTGLSRLSKRERQVRDIVDAGEVRYEVITL